MADLNMDLFSPEARWAFEDGGQAAAKRYQHNYVGTEHVLLAVLANNPGRAARLFERLKVDPSKVASAIEFLIGRGDKEPAWEKSIELTPRVKKVAELAVDEARRMNYRQVDVEHVILGFLRDKDGIAANVLVSLGVNLEMLRLFLKNPYILLPMEEIEELSKEAARELSGKHTLLQLAETALANTEDRVKEAREHIRQVYVEMMPAEKKRDFLQRVKDLESQTVS
ncbi:MAG: Clp protease N-terminal domain-containing protein [bacterium]|nr:Clp protease N-terminal domain-containing protein [bacterium]